MPPSLRIGRHPSPAPLTRPEATALGPVFDTDEVDESPENATYQTMSMAICKKGLSKARAALCNFENWLQPFMMAQNIMAVAVMQEITNQGEPVVQDDPQVSRHPEVNI